MNFARSMKKSYAAASVNTGASFVRSSLGLIADALRASVSVIIPGVLVFRLLPGVNHILNLRIA